MAQVSRPIPTAPNPQIAAARRRRGNKKQWKLNDEDGVQDHERGRGAMLVAVILLPAARRGVAPCRRVLQGGRHGRHFRHREGPGGRLYSPAAARLGRNKGAALRVGRRRVPAPAVVASRAFST